MERHLDDTYGAIYSGKADDITLAPFPSGSLLQEHTPWDLLKYSWSTMQFKYGAGTKGWTYRQEEDAFLLTMMHRHGYGAARRIHMEIRRAWQFRFDWFFKSRSPPEIQKRCDVIIKNVEKEMEEVREKEQQEERKNMLMAGQAAFNPTQVAGGLLQGQQQVQPQAVLAAPQVLTIQD